MIAKLTSNLVSLDSPKVFAENRSGEPAAALGIGQTPLLQLRRLADRIGLPGHVDLWLKGEWTNPGGSIKDRPALAIVRDALASGALADGRILLDATSGNTGIAYAMLGAAYGFPVELVLPTNLQAVATDSLAARVCQWLDQRLPTVLPCSDECR